MAHKSKYTPEAYERRLIQSRKRAAEFRVANPEIVKERQRIAREKRALRDPNHKRDEYQRNKKSYADYSLRKNYGISLKQRDQMYANQGKRCAACGREMTLNKGNVSTAAHVDHNHLTGEVRGLLCSRCNIALGMVGDSIEILQSLVGYLMP